MAISPSATDCRRVIAEDEDRAAMLRCFLEHPELDGSAARLDAKQAASQEASPTRKLLITTDSDTWVAVFLRRPDFGLALNTALDSLHGIDFATAAMVDRSSSLVAARPLTVGETWQLEVPGDAVVRAGDDQIELVGDADGTAALQPDRLAFMRKLAPERFRQVQVVDQQGAPVPGARVTSSGRVMAVTDQHGRVWLSHGSEPWAIAEQGMSLVTTGDVLKLTHPRQRCRFIDRDGREVLPSTWCDTMPVLHPLLRACSAEFTRDDPSTVSVCLSTTLHLRMPGILALNHVSEAILVDAMGEHISLGQHYSHEGMTPGPAKLYVAIDDDWWYAEFEIGRLVTTVRPSFQRCSDPGIRG